jgi:hypothetical protein
MFPQRRTSLPRTSLFFVAIFALSLSLGAPDRTWAQEAAPQAGDRAQFAGMQRTGGEVTAVAGNKITLKTEDSGVMQVTITDNTRLVKGRGVALKMADIKVGDGLTAAGNLDAPNKTLHAAIVFVVDAEQVKDMKENLGKTYIAGKVTAIDLDNATMTVERPDKVAQTIGFDENTSFRRGGRVNMGAFGGGYGGGRGEGGRGEGNGTPPAPTGGESITLADIKVGDTVGGQGALKGGVFVPKLLTVANPGGGRRRAAAAPTTEPAVPPAAAPPQV